MEGVSMSEKATQPSFLSTGRGKLTLALACAAGFLDFIDTTIVNIALPSIRKDVPFSVQSLQWVWPDPGWLIQVE
jgi:hypothetical protein